MTPGNGPPPSAGQIAPSSGSSAGEKVGERTLELIEDALEWPRDTTLLVLDGADLQLLPARQSHPAPLHGLQTPKIRDADLHEISSEELYDLLEAIGQELRRRDSELLPMAAFRQPTESGYEARARVQDEAAETADAPGPEHGA